MANVKFAVRAREHGPGEPIELLSVWDDIEAQMIRELLKGNGIESVMIDKMGGDYLRVYMGNSIYRKVIMVEPAQWERAKRLIEEMLSNVEDGDIPEYEELSRQRERKRWSFIWMLGAIVILLFVLGCAASVFL